MKTLLVSTLLIIGSLNAVCQDSKWSMLPDNSKKKADKTVSSFIKAINQNADLTTFFTGNEANYAGQIWMPLNQYTKFIKSILPTRIDSAKFEFFDFDDVDSSQLIKAKAHEFSRVFNNFSILALGTVNNKEATLILQPVNSDIRIYSITIGDVGLQINDQKSDLNFDSIPIIKMAIAIPPDFEGPFTEKEMIIYTLRGETERDAIIQIMSFPKKAPIKLICEQWVNYITSDYKRSDFEISYFLNGYKFDYEVVDQNNSINKGITVSLENNGYSIILQYFGFKSTYNTHWKQIDEMIRNLNLY